MAQRGPPVTEPGSELRKPGSRVQPPAIPQLPGPWDRSPRWHREGRLSPLKGPGHVSQQPKDPRSSPASDCRAVPCAHETRPGPTRLGPSPPAAAARLSRALLSRLDRLLFCHLGCSVSCQYCSTILGITPGGQASLTPAPGDNDTPYQSDERSFNNPCSLPLPKQEGGH